MEKYREGRINRRASKVKEGDRKRMDREGEEEGKRAERGGDDDSGEDGEGRRGGGAGAVDI